VSRIISAARRYYITLSCGCLPPHTAGPTRFLGNLLASAVFVNSIVFLVWCAVLYVSVPVPVPVPVAIPVPVSGSVSVSVSISVSVSVPVSVLCLVSCVLCLVSCVLCLCRVCVFVSVTVSGVWCLVSGVCVCVCV